MGARSDIWNYWGFVIMNKKKTKKEFEIWIKNQIKYYKPYLGLDLHRIFIKYNEDINYLQISFTYPYLEPTISYSDKAFDNWKIGVLLKDRILHELVHIITDPLYAKATSRYVAKDEIEDEREHLADTLAMILNNLIK